MQQPHAQPYMAPMQRPPLQPIQMNNQGNAPTYNRGNNTRDNTRTSNPNHPVKRYENQNYCHSCGFDVKSTHNSQTCPKPRPGHQYNTTRFNTMGGSIAGSHKTIMPSAAGKVCAEDLRLQRGGRRQQQQQNGMQTPQNGYQQATCGATTSNTTNRSSLEPACSNSNS